MNKLTKIISIIINFICEEYFGIKGPDILRKTIRMRSDVEGKQTLSEWDSVTVHEKKTAGH